MWSLVVLLLAGLAQADSSVGTGVWGTAGSEGYRSLSLFADAEWTRRGVDPYAWGDFTVSRASKRFSAVGGLSRDLSRDWRAGAGMGFSAGRFDDANSSSAAFLLEAQADRRWLRSAAGLGYRLSVGELTPPTAAPGEDSRARNNAKNRGARRGRTSPDPETSTYNELSGFVRFPIDRARLTLKLALGFPSYADEVVSETATLRLPFNDVVSALASLTLEQSDRTRAYGSLGVSCFWD